MVDTIKSASITSLDTIPPFTPTTGEGAPGYSRNASDYVLPTTGGLGSTSSTYRMVRVPTVAKIKSIYLSADGALDSSTGLEFNVGLAYSDSTVDGTPSSDQGATINATLFATDLTGFQSSASGPVYALGNFTWPNHQTELWAAAGLSEDPGGFFDIVVAVAVVATTAASHNLGINVEFVD